LNQNINFSLWLDFIERNFLESGEFDKMIKDGIINGATSNPAIFQQAFTNSPAYISKIESLKKEGLLPEEIYENLAISDIQLTAKKLLPLFENKNMGFVSIEVNPFFADNTEATIEEGIRLFRKIGFPNVMIKIPATDFGYLAMEELFAKDIPVNATLIFSLEEAIKSAEAMKRGLARSCKKSAKGVLSVFVSRLDKAVSSTRFGIANSSKIYREIESRKYKNITTLFASTGVKDDSLEPDYYIRELLAENSINTAPLKTIQAYQKTGMDGIPKLPLDLKTETEIISQIDSANEILIKLKKEGLESFKTSFSNMMEFLK